MTRWKQVKWTEARQVTALLGWPASEHDTKPPEMFFDALRAEGRDDDAALFLGQALPRFESVAWAARSVRDLTPANGPQADNDALKTVFLWLQDPSENRRRAAFDAAAEATDVCPQRMCALAVFFSGGSLGPSNAQPVLAPKDAAGRFASVAVLVAATRSGARDEGLDRALKLGDAMACGEAVRV
jgi:hypothetical protein